MRSAPPAAILLAVLLVGPAAAEPPPTKSDALPVVLLAQRPVLLRLDLRLDGKSFAAARQAALQEYLTALFRHLDGNGDGTLSEAEARRMPPPVRTSGDPNRPANRVAFNYRVIDADGDGRVTPEELKTYYGEFSGGTVAIRATAGVALAGGVNDRIFEKLDADKDGKLSAAELASASALFDLDADRNELLEPRELLPNAAATNPRLTPPAAAGMAGPAQAGTSGVFAITSPDDRVALATALLQRYGFGTGRLARESVNLEQTAFAGLDTDRDGALDVDELTRFADREPDVEMVIRIGSRAGAEPVVEVRGRGENNLNLPGGSRLEVHVNEGRPRQTERSRDGILQLFRSAVGKSGSLSAADAAQASFFPAQFPLLDRDGDGKLTEAELTAYLTNVQDRQAALAATTPALLISGSSGGLFQLLDRDQNGRLSLREVREAPRLPDRLGLDKDRAIGREDLRPCYRLAVGAGMATLNRAGTGAFTPQGMPMVTLGDAVPGLVWFQKMDRNRDGDVSPSEFLGPLDAFSRIDADGDGLLSREEAERADSLFRRSP
jgi:Ca2+-binding EF-hand superfamily protein